MMLIDDDDSRRIEELLSVWYAHEVTYLPALGAPRVSPSCRGYDPGEIHDDADSRDALLNKLTAEGVAYCIDQLNYLQRAAINVHCRNKATGASVHRNPRLGSVEDQHKAYQEAKVLLSPIMQRKGLL